MNHLRIRNFFIKAKLLGTLYIIKLWYYKIQTVILENSDLNIKKHCYEFNYLIFKRKKIIAVTQ